MTERFDHHCVWTNCCIGSRNLRWLVLLFGTSVVALLASALRAYLALTASDTLAQQIWCIGYAASCLTLSYPVSCFFVTLMSSISINATNAELRGAKPQGLSDYLSISPYFNAWDFGSDYNMRACFNGYAMERARWSEPTQLTKLLAALAAKSGSAHGQSGHQHGPSCNHGPEPSPASPKPTAAATAKPTAAQRPAFKPTADNNV